jgi:hypothetical protein
VVTPDPVVASPPDPFVPRVSVVEPGTLLYRVHSNGRPTTAFNPGVGEPTRFAFFGDPVVPALYAAETQEAALSETLLRNIPLEGGRLLFDDYRDNVMGRLEVTRQLRLASLHGPGLRQLGVENTAVIDVYGDPDYVYSRTVKWAEAAHRAGFDGLEWMSRRCNDSRAQVFFGDRFEPGDLVADPSFGRAFLSTEGFEWLVDICAPMHIEVMPPTLGL